MKLRWFVRPVSRLYLAQLDFHLSHSWLFWFEDLGPPLNLLGYLCLLANLDHPNDLNLVADVLACRRADVAGVGDRAGVLV